MQITNTAIATSHRAAPAPDLWLGTAHAVTLAVAVNTLLFLSGSALNLFPQDVLIRGADAPITLGRVIVATALGVGGGAGMYALLRRFTMQSYRIFGWIVLAALLLSFTQPPLMLERAPLAMMLALNALHIVAAAALLRALKPGVGSGGRNGNR